MYSTLYYHCQPEADQPTAEAIAECVIKLQSIEILAEKRILFKFTWHCLAPWYISQGVVTVFFDRGVDDENIN